MRALKLVPVALCFLVLGAHSSRSGWPLAVSVLLAALPLLLLVRRPWAPRVLQVVLLVGAAEWVRTLFGHAAVRRAHGEPWLRMAIILGVVALATALSSLALRNWSRNRTREEAA